MWTWLTILTIILVLILALAVVLGAFVWAVGRPISLAQARKLFHQQREHLEAQFFELAAASGKPRGLRWKECEWEDAVEFARDRDTGQIVALVGVTISFEAVEGSDMEGLPAVGNLRNAAAVFYFDQGRWATLGRAVFNLNPDEAIRHFGNRYEPLPGEDAGSL